MPQSASVAGVWQSYEIYALWMLVVGGRLLASLVACRDAAMAGGGIGNSNRIAATRP